MLRRRQAINPITQAKKLCDELAAHNKAKTNDIISLIPFTLDGIKDFIAIHHPNITCGDVYRVFTDINVHNELCFYFLLDVIQNHNNQHILISIGVPTSVCQSNSKEAVVEHLVAAAIAEEQATVKLFEEMMEQAEIEPTSDESFELDPNDKPNRTLH